MSRRPLCLVAALFVLWITGMGLAGKYRPIPLPDTCSNRMIRVRGEIYRQEKKNTNQIYLKNNSILSGTTKSFTSNIIIFTNEETRYEIGNILEVTGICTAPERAGNPGQFDMAGWYQAQNIGMLLMKSHTKLIDGGKNRFRQGISEFRAKLQESFCRIAEEKDASLMSAMLLGDKNGIDDEVKQLYQEGGISHILAISGLHISMIGMLLFAGIRRMGMPFVGAGMVSGVVMGIYCIMTGMSVSAFRAFVMFLVYLGAQVLGRTYDLKNSLSLAVILALFENPLLLFQGGFQLSVLAVSGLAYVYPMLKKRLKVKRKSADSFLVSLSVQMAIFPCVLYHYYEFSAAGIFLNLLVLPCMSALLLFGMAGCAAGMFFVPAGVFVFAPCHYLLGFVETACALSLRIPGTRQVWGRPGWGNLLVYYGLLLLVLRMMKREERQRKTWVLCAILLLCGTAGLSFRQVKGMEMTFLDVGQGDAIFWETEDGICCLCDGGSSSVPEVGRYRIIPFLKCKGVSRINYLFLTHMDEDHVNGAEEILKGDEIMVDSLVLPEIRAEDERYKNLARLAKQRGIQVIRFHDGMGIKSGNWKIECLSPQRAEQGEDKNAASMVLALQYGKFRALLTGDIEGEGEARLIRSGEIGKISVLKVAHHGSNNSTPEELLQQADPEAAVISCGRENRYGHPGAELMERLEKSRADIYQTMESGAVMVETDGKKFIVRVFRK